MSEKDIWNLQDAPLTSHIRNAGRYTAYMLGKHFPGINAAIMNNVSLYRFLLLHRHESAADLRERILDNGKPIFSVADLDAILKIIQKHAGLPFSKWLISQGGGAVSSATASAAEIPVAVPVTHIPVATLVNPLDADPSRSKFWDMYIRKISHPFVSQIPPSWDGILWYMFLLYQLENTDLLGPTISTVLDSITLTLPVMADLVQEVTEKVLSLAPIPYAGLVGEALGMAISLIFVVFAVGLNVSRKHFGSAFKAALEGIPILGDILAEGAQSFEIGAERYLNNRKRILGSVDQFSPHAEDFLNYYIPDVEVKAGPAPPFNINKVKKNVANYVIRETGMENAMAAVSDPTAFVSGAVSGAVNKATTAATGAVTGAVSAGTNAINKTLRGGRRYKHRFNKTIKRRR